MRQAQTLNEAQFRRILHYCRSRRHPVRDTTIFMVSFYAGLRAKEIAALELGDVFDEFPIDTLFPGIFLIIFSGLTILWREQRQKNE